MRLFAVSLIFLLLGFSFNNKQIIGAMILSHRTGCIDGLMSVMELEAYVRPDKYKTAEEAWKHLKLKCKEKNEKYTSEISN